MRFRLLALALGILPCASCASAASQQQQARQTFAEEGTADELFRRGEASTALGDMTRAEQYFMAALRAGGDEKKITERLLTVCVTDHRYPMAIEHAENYLSRHPNDAEVQFAAASIHLALGHNARARQLLEAVVKHKPNWPEPHYLLATTLRQQGESLELADVHDLEYLRLDPSGPLAERARERIKRSP